MLGRVNQPTSCITASECLLTRQQGTKGRVSSPPEEVYHLLRLAACGTPCLHGLLENRSCRFLPSVYSPALTIAFHHALDNPYRFHDIRLRDLREPLHDQTLWFWNRDDVEIFIEGRKCPVIRELAAREPGPKKHSTRIVCRVAALVHNPSAATRQLSALWPR